MIKDSIFETVINAPVRAFRGRVEFYEGSTLTLMCGCHDNLKTFTVERVGEENKFFGYGVCQKINIKLVDKDRQINLSTANTAEVVFGKDSDYIYPCPRFHITQVRRDETTNELSITAYDDLYEASKHLITEVIYDDALFPDYTIRELATACATLLGLPIGELDEAFDTYYETGANFSGTETVRDALNAIAEATQTIYFIDWDWKLQFKRLDVAGEPVLTIDKSKYFSLDSGDNRRLSKIYHTTELGDNLVGYASLQSGSSQYVRNNPFWELRDDAYQLIYDGARRLKELTINQFDCSWRGNFLLEIGDKIALITKNDETVYSYVLNDVMTFDGSLSQETQWHYEDNDEVETAAAPVSLGEAINNTYARVDKINNEIELATSKVDANTAEISRLRMDTQSITASVERIEQTTAENFEIVNDDITTLTQRVEASMTAEDVSIAIQKEMNNGVGKVITSTGFRFDEVGLTVSKTDSEMTTTITEDGMTVYKDNNAVLTANNTGVDAVNLRASTYLIIGTNSRFEDSEGRTACFWIGG